MFSTFILYIFELNKVTMINNNNNNFNNPNL